MKSFNSLPVNCEPSSRRSCICFPATSFLVLVFFISSAFIYPEYKEKLSTWSVVDKFQNLRFIGCKSQCRPPGSETLPLGIVSQNSNLEMRPLWGFPKKTGTSSIGLFAVAVGIRQKDLVNNVVQKFLSSNFSVMLFHYDRVIDEWREYEWCDRVIHVSAPNQTKWWFAKRFMHPDIVAEYNYIFLWDEDLGVDNFDPQRYLSIVKREGLEISQPAIDPGKSEVHQQITARVRKSVVHRRTFKPGLCYGNSTSPPCTGWVEMMAPVFSRSAWRCVWYMIQNDLIHAWGLDYQLGYCVQGDRKKNIGVVDAEYIVHYGRPTLGGSDVNKTTSVDAVASEQENIAPAPATLAPPQSHKHEPRVEVRRQSYAEYKIFQKRWAAAAEEDACWTDQYKQPVKGGGSS